MTLKKSDNSKKQIQINIEQQIEQVVSLPNIPIRELTTIYNKLQELEKFDQIRENDTDLFETVISFLEIDWTQSNKSTLVELEAKKQKLMSLNKKTKIHESLHASKVAINAVKEFKNLQPLLPDITHILNMIIRQAQTMENILNRGRGEWFVSEIEQSTEQYISLEQLYANYKMYCTTHKQIAVIKSVFGKDFLNMANYFKIDPIKSRNKNGVLFRGVQFKPGVKLAPIVNKKTLN